MTPAEKTAEREPAAITWDAQGTAWAAPQDKAPSAILLLTHGAFSTAEIWSYRLMPALAEAGYVSVAPTFARRDRWGRVQGLRAFASQVADVAQEARQRYPNLPLILVGHSLGTIIVQRLWHSLGAAAQILLAPVPPEGLWFCSWRLGLLNPRLSWTLSAASVGIIPSERMTRAALFGSHADPRLVSEVHSGFVSESLTALMEAQAPQLYRQAGKTAGCPMLVMGANGDRIIPPDAVGRAALYHGVKAQMLDDAGHALMVDTRWPDVLAAMLDWLDTQDLGLAEDAPAMALAAE